MSKWNTQAIYISPLIHSAVVGRCQLNRVTVPNFPSFSLNFSVSRFFVLRQFQKIQSKKVEGNRNL